MSSPYSDQWKTKQIASSEHEVIFLSSRWNRRCRLKDAKRGLSDRGGIRAAKARDGKHG